MQGVSNVETVAGLKLEEQRESLLKKVAKLNQQLDALEGHIKYKTNVKEYLEGELLTTNRDLARVDDRIEEEELLYFQGRCGIYTHSAKQYELFDTLLSNIRLYNGIDTAQLVPIVRAAMELGKTQ